MQGGGGFRSIVVLFNLFLVSMPVSQKSSKTLDKYSNKYSRESVNAEPKKSNLFFSILKVLFWISFFGGLIAGSALFGWVYWTMKTGPTLEELHSSGFSQSSVILDASGENVLYELIGNEDRIVLDSLDQVSENMQKAMLAAEDAGFYEHKGFSITGIGRAVRDAILSGRAEGGGSTITQQLIKMVVFAEGEEGMKEKIERKVREIGLARELENKYSKDQILLLYLNKVPFGGSIYGVEKASQVFFEKPASELTIAESALLAGLPQAPGRYQRVKTSYINLDPEQINTLGIKNFSDLMSRENEVKDTFVRGIFGKDWEFSNGSVGYIPGRVDYVLAQMLDKNFITNQEYDTARQELNTLTIKESRVNLQAPHFVFYAQEEAEQILKETLGEGSEKELYQRGYKIITTLDFDLNNTVQEIIAKHGEKAEEYNIRNTAGMVMDSKTGAILSMIGSRDYFATEISGHDFDGEVNVITSRRQPGSTFKPLVFAGVFEQKGLSPATVLMDIKTNLSLGKKPYFPRNYAGDFSGPVSIRKALGTSLNIPAVKAGIILGIPELYDFVQKFGISFVEEKERFGPSMALGAPVIKPLEMATAFSVFANQGKKVEAFSVLKIIDGNGKIVYERDIQKIQENASQVISPETAFLITDILSDESGESRPVSWNSYLSLSDRPSAAKTGTSTGKENGVTHPHDVWTVGYTPQRTALVWMGNNKGWEENPKGFLRDDATGLINAGTPWKEIMLASHEGLEIESFSRPEGVKKISVSTLSGKRVPSDFPESFITEDYFSVGALPDKEDTSLQIVRLEEVSQKLPNEYTPESAIKEFVYLEFNSYFPENPLWEDPVKEWLSENGAKLSEELGIPNIIPFLPQSYTDLYSQYTLENAPQISILSPSNMGIVSPPRVNIETSVSAPNGVDHVLLSWNGTIVARKTEKPWVFTIPLEESKVGSLHVLEAEVRDKLGYTSNMSVNVKVGEDTLPPDISFLYPSNNTILTTGELVQIGVEAIDRNSSVKKVNLFLDGNLLETFTSRPYQYSWTVEGVPGNHSLQAIALDEAGNTSEKTLSFSIQKSDISPSINPEPLVSEWIPDSRDSSQTQERVLAVLSPSSGEVISGTVPVSFSVPIRMRVPGVQIKVLYRQVGGGKGEVFSISGDKIPPSGVVNLSWSPENIGEYSLYVSGEGDQRDFSSKTRIEVQ